MLRRVASLAFALLLLDAANLAGLPAGADPVASEGASGRFRKGRPRPPAVDDETYQRLIGLGYLQGYSAAPAASDVTVYRKAAAYDGLNFVVSGHAPEASVMDMAGNTLHTWRYRPATEIWPGARKGESGAFWRRAHLFPNGDLLAIYELGGLVKLDRNSNLLWSQRGPHRPHHDLEVLDDGRIFVLTAQRKTLPAISPAPVLDEYITVLDADGKQLAEHSIVDLIARSPYASLLEREIVKSGGYYGHILHTNTIEVFDGALADRSPLFKKGNVLLSILMLDTVGIADLDAGRFVWMLGDGIWSKQHQPTLLANGNLLVFDNRHGADCSRVVEVEPLTGDVAWTYTGCDGEPFYSASCGSNQRLPNGNTLITETDNGRAFELTPEGEIVWEYLSPHRVGTEGELIASLLEVIRIDPDAFPFLAATEGPTTEAPATEAPAK